MADERCVFPGDGPRTPGRWLDRDTAERLLRGEPLDNAVAADARDQAQRLSHALAALSAPPLTADAEPPGEAAALAAFREARDGRAAAAFLEAGDVREADAEVVRIGGRTGGRIGGRVDQGERRSRWGRSVRLGLSAALAAGMVGGVAAAVGVGVLPKPFGGVEPAPASSVSAPVTPDEHPLLSASPEIAPGGEADSATPEGADGGSSDSGSPRATAGGTQGDDSDDRSARGTGWGDVASACRDVRDGRELAADRKRTLEGVAGSWSRVRTYCKSVLDGDTGRWETRDTRDDAKDKGDAKDRGGKDNGKGSGKGGKGGEKEQGGNDDLGDRGGRADHDGRHHSRGTDGGHHSNTGGSHHSNTGGGHRP
ncbi:hypothetical protein ACFYWX_06720 [Streptomyces sp. NPDC002888]|uniref:hypothetical protein n=1 Tax=Streptomyces sp. NPDC002888 TaxID=3364668 RepID=UPI003675B452